MSHSLYNIPKNLGTIVVLIGHLLLGLFIALGRKIRTDGIPKSVQCARSLKNLTIFSVRKLNEVCWPNVKKAGQVSKILFIFTAQKLTTKGVHTLIRISQSIKGLSIPLYRKAKRVVENKIDQRRYGVLADQVLRVDLHPTVF